AQSGKTTNLEQIHRFTDPAGTNRLISLNTGQDRTLFFDLLPFSLGTVSGYDFKVQLYTVPGQVQYNATRRVVLAGADAVVFVADSRKSALKENQASFENMKVNLLANRLVPEKVPLVLQYNKQDLPNLLPQAEMNKALNFWGRKAFPAVAARGEGVLETFVAVVQEMLAAIAVKFNLKEKGLDPVTVPEVVAQAFSNLLKKAPGSPASPGQGSPARVVLSSPADAPAPAVPAAGDASPVSEELLHRAIRSNVELAEALSDVVREMNQGLAKILSHAELLLSLRDEGKRTGAVDSIQREAVRLRHLIQQLGQADPRRAPAPANPPPVVRPAGSTGSVPAVRPAAAHPTGSVPAGPGASVPAAAAMPASPTGSSRAAALDGLLDEAVASVRSVLDTRGVAVENRVSRGTNPPRCPPASLRKAATALLRGIAAVSPAGSAIVVRCERKPVLLRGRDGEVKRDFLMLALGHGATLTTEDQQRMLQGADPGPLGEAYRLVREMGGFMRFAPLPGGALETRVFLPAA
ncbi:MAG TPA: ADP-ribosylation factor-like protein, partial [Vicinamibacteria bacterium]|nr:ADP-ribosylation factor-like protein [Vicinamibacteria bacterium]